ncbi:hypothetical protein ALNOE001_12150 [Candidatus Methanobinarius endosymbioticus]|uniref:ABC transmembrane type-1 domain-containing protein n=1 Tax=Candidatus Methanobinarius endosymbioticus TaxID=2006182 RepID=A0A366M9Q4_9EURY|nr:hypothetical protein ALNOE001_12150 [Candidatus Methanobinarius endosymbioticus]
MIAIIIGLTIGIIVSEYQKNKWILSLINFIYTIPAITLFGFLIPFTGIGDISAIIALTIYVLLPMVRYTHSGIVNIDKNIIKAAKGMENTKLQILYKIKLPLALPRIMSAIRTMVVMTIALTGIATFIGAERLSVAIYREITTNNIVMTAAGSILIAILVIIVDFILGQIKKLTQYERHRSNFEIKVRSIFFNKKTVLRTFLIIICVFAGGQLLANSTEDIINIATKPMPEQYIIGAMLEELIEQDSNLNIELRTGVGGGTSTIQPGMEKEEFDMYPEYTGTDWMEVLKEKGVYNESSFSQLQFKYNQKYYFTWEGCMVLMILMDSCN